MKGKCAFNGRLLLKVLTDIVFEVVLSLLEIMILTDSLRSMTSTILGTNGLNSADVALSNKHTNTHT